MRKRKNGSRPASHEVYVLSTRDPDAELRLVTPDYKIQPGDYFMHDASEFDRGSKDEFDRLRRTRMPERIRSIQQELDALGPYGEACQATGISEDERADFNQWLAEQDPADAPFSLHLFEPCRLQGLIDAYAYAVEHGKSHYRIGNITKRLLRAIACGLYTSKHYRNFDAKHGFSEDYPSPPLKENGSPTR